MTGLHRSSIVGLILAAGLATGCRGGNATEAAAQAASQAAPEPASPGVAVEVLTVEPQPFTERLRVVGDVEADRSVTVAAEEGGVVRRVFVERGDYVEARAPIAKVDDRVLRAQVAQAEASAALARESWERQRRLWEQEEIGTEMAYLEARYGAEQAEANLDLLRTRLERTTVLAPFAGVIDARTVEVGSMLSPGAPVARLVDVDTVRVVAGVPERYARDVRVGAEARISLDLLADQALDGEVAFVGTVVNQQNRTFAIEVVVPNPTVGRVGAGDAAVGAAAGGGRGRLIKPGMVANVSIVRRTTDAAILVPQDAVFRTEDGYGIYVVEGGGDARVARARVVTLGATDGDRVAIRTGLEAGDRVIVVGQKQVVEGDAVRIVEGVRGE